MLLVPSCAAPLEPEVGLGLELDEWEEPEEPVGDDEATVGVPLVGPAVATAPTPPVCTPVLAIADSLGPIALAALMKDSALPLPLAGALMAPTMPRPQCAGNLQKK